MKIELDEKTSTEFVAQCPQVMTPTEFIYDLLILNKKVLERPEEDYEAFKKKLKEEIIAELKPLIEGKKPKEKPEEKKNLVVE